MTALFEKCFHHKIQTRKIWKISVEAVDKIKTNEVRDLLGVLVVQVEFDINRFVKADVITKKQIALETLYRGVKTICDWMKWPEEPFKAAYDCIIEKGYRNEWTWGKAKWNKSRTKTAEIYCVHDVESFKMHVLIRDKKKKELSRIVLVDDTPDEFVFSRYLGRIEWISDHEIGVIAKDQGSHWLVKLDDANVLSMI